MTKKLNNKKGSILVVTIILSTTILIVMASFLTLNSTQSGFVKKSSQNIEQTYALDILSRAAIRQMKDISNRIPLTPNVFSSSKNPLTPLTASYFDHTSSSTNLASLSGTNSELYAGPVFWKTVNSANIADVLCFGKITTNYQADANSPIQARTAYTFMLCRITDQPFSDALIFSEHDTANYSQQIRTWDGPVHCNGNLRMGAGSSQTYTAAVSCAGYLMNSGSSHVADMNVYNSSIPQNTYSMLYKNFVPNFSTDADVKFSTPSGGSVSYKGPSGFYTSNDNGSGAIWNGVFPKDNFGNYAASVWGPNLKTALNGVQRLMCPGLYPEKDYGVTTIGDYNEFTTTPVNTLSRLREKYFGTHTLIEPALQKSLLASGGTVNSSLVSAGDPLSNTQIYDKLQLIETQKIASQCGLVCSFESPMTPYPLNARGSVARELNERYIYPQGTYTPYVPSDLDIYNTSYISSTSTDVTPSLWNSNNIAYARYDIRACSANQPFASNGENTYGYNSFTTAVDGFSGVASSSGTSFASWPICLKTGTSCTISGISNCSGTILLAKNSSGTDIAGSTNIASGNFSVSLTAAAIGNYWIGFKNPSSGMLTTWKNVSITGNSVPTVKIQQSNSGSTYFKENLVSGKKSVDGYDLSTQVTTQSAIYIAKDTNVPQYVEYDGTKWVVTLNPIKRSNGRNVMWDNRRRKWVYLIEVDASKLSTLPLANKGIYIQLPDETGTTTLSTDLPASTKCQYYVTDSSGNGTGDVRYNYMANQFNDTARITRHPQTDPIAFGVRLINAAALSSPLTLATNGALYIQGSVNNTGTRQNVLLAADSITVLSDKWLDYESRCSTKPYTDNLAPSAIKINASLITGSTHPGFITNANGTLIAGGDRGIEDAIRILETRYPLDITVTGSIAVPYYSKTCWEPWSPAYENAGTLRTFKYYPSYHNTTTDARTDLPTAIPYYRSFAAVIADKALNEQQFNTLKSLWTSSSFWSDQASYDAALSSFLSSNQ